MLRLSQNISRSSAFRHSARGAESAAPTPRPDPEELRRILSGPEGQALLRKWGIPEHYVCRCFVLLGYVDGEYPSPKPRKSGRIVIVEG